MALRGDLTAALDDKNKGQHPVKDKQKPTLSSEREFGEEQSESGHLFSSRNSSTVSLLSRMNKPTDSDIRKWMTDTQHCVDNVVNNWQQVIIDESQQVSTLLHELYQLMSILDRDFYWKYFSVSNSGSPASDIPFLLSTKHLNCNGVLESTINIYLQIIAVAANQVRQNLDRGDSLKERYEYHLCLEILGEFSLVAEDAFKFLRTHEKYLLPICSRLIAMRDELYIFLQPVISQSSVAIIPLVGVSQEFRKKQNQQRLNKQEPSLAQYPYVEIEVGSKNYRFKRPENLSETSSQTKEEEDPIEKLNLIRLLLKQIGLAIDCSREQCCRSHHQLSDICTRLTGKFEEFLRNLEVESRRNRLKLNSCSTSLKKSLCQLEVELHEVERLIEEIPERMRRVIGVADHISRQIVASIGDQDPATINYVTKDNAVSEQAHWTSPIKDLSEEFLKPQHYFPMLWKLLAKLMGGRNNGKKLREFWEQVKTELESFHKEINIKEMDSQYSLKIRVPIPKDNPPGLLRFAFTTVECSDYKQIDKDSVTEENNTCHR